MSDNILDELMDIFEIRQDTEIGFKEIYGFIFVFMTKFTRFNDEITSAEIEPAGIIYKENDEYYFAPLDEAENIHEIVKEYVRHCIEK